jgi:hypothetical protein
MSHICNLATVDAKQNENGQADPGHDTDVKKKQPEIAEGIDEYQSVIPVPSLS